MGEENRGSKKGNKDLKKVRCGEINPKTNREGRNKSSSKWNMARIFVPRISITIRAIERIRERERYIYISSFNFISTRCFLFTIRGKIGNEALHRRSVNTYPERFNSKGSRVFLERRFAPFLTPAAFPGNIRKCIPRFSSARALLTNVCPPVHQEPGFRPPPAGWRGGMDGARARKKAEERSGKRTYAPKDTRGATLTSDDSQRLPVVVVAAEQNRRKRRRPARRSAELDRSLAQTPATLHNC